MSNKDQELSEKPVLWIHGIGYLPQNLLSLTVGGIVRAKLPKFIAKPVNKLFVKAFGINMTEAEKPLAEYRTIEDVFTRRLSPGARKVGQGLVSPADGRLVKSEAVQAGRGVQAKGRTYSLSDLVFGKTQPVPEDFKPGWFVTVYLAPHNYHRVHTPSAATVKALRYIPGKLWPVNDAAVKTVPSLFCTNERLVFDLVLPGGGKIWAVMVGALNVGRMESPILPNFVSNSAGRQFSELGVQETALEHCLSAGDELGTFMLGSTVVLVLDQEATKIFNPIALTESRDVRMGQSLSRS
jgi:phosphatidylserine decarboxylase